MGRLNLSRQSSFTRFSGRRVSSPSKSRTISFTSGMAKQIAAGLPSTSATSAISVSTNILYSVAMISSSSFVNGMKPQLSFQAELKTSRTMSTSRRKCRRSIGRTLTPGIALVFSAIRLVRSSTCPEVYHQA